MKAATYKNSTPCLEVNEVKIPQPGTKEVVLKVHACGICGSDIHAVRNKKLLTGAILGHEFAGTIANLGNSCDEAFKVGDRVFAIPVISCGKCWNCVNDKIAFCVNGKYLGALEKTDMDGAYAEYVLVGQESLFRLGDEISFEEAALVEPLSTALRAVKSAELRPGERVLIIGGGPIGASISMWAKFVGAKSITVVEPNEKRRKYLRHIGVTDVLVPDAGDSIAEMCNKLYGEMPGIIFEAVGIKGIINQCINIAEPWARIIIAGFCGESDNLDIELASMKNLKLFFVAGYLNSDCELTISMIREKRIQAASLITKTISLTELPYEFDKLLRQGAEYSECKIIVNTN